MAKEKFEIRGLRNCLRKYDEKGKYATSGKWSIATGGYDLYWQLCYEEEPLIDNVCNELTVDNRYDYSNLNEVISIILEEYKNVNISYEVSRELFYELGDSEVDFFCGRKSLDEHKKLLDYNKKFFRDNNEVIGYYEQTVKNIEKGFDEFGVSYKDAVKSENYGQAFEEGDILEDKRDGMRVRVSDICVCENDVGDYERFRWEKCYIFKNSDGDYLPNTSGHYVDGCIFVDKNYKKVGEYNFDLFGSLRNTNYYNTKKGRLLFSMVFDSNNKEVELYTIENGKKNIVCKAINVNNIPTFIPMEDYHQYVDVNSKLEKDFEKFVRSCDGFSNFSMYFFDKNGKPSERKSTENGKTSERKKPTLTFWF